MTALKNIALVGASGAIGRIILDALIASSSFTITVISRKESEVVFPEGIAVYKSDFSDADLEAVFKGKDVVISALGATGFGEQQKLVDAAVRAGVQRFIPSEFSASSQDDTVIQLLPLFGQKKALIEYLKGKEANGLTWTGIATSGLLDWGLGNGFLQFDLANRTATIWDGGHKSFTLINEKALGQSVVSVLQKPEQTKNKFLHVASVETNQLEILTALEKATGSKWTVQQTTTKAQLDEAASKLAAGNFEGAFILVRATVFGNTPGLKSNYVKDTELANDILGLKLESLEETVRRVVNN